ncbi:MAG TPA: peroxiredoxin [Phycisphaerae bacterium]|nr:peroxiredoxin [Phycisphaerae bacterium]HRR84916.1 peroxiredoxin [Phycisphaerae bacterium]
MRYVSRKLGPLLIAIVVGLLPAGCASTETVGPAASLEARTDLIPVGQKAPDFDAADQSGKRIRLAELLKKSSVVLIFYPGDFTPGCTRQLCAVRDDWSQFEKHGITVLGVNPADAVQHARFVGENRFPFSLIVDEGSSITAAYGARGPDRTQRTVYAIRKDGKVALAERGFVAHEKIFAALK